MPLRITTTGSAGSGVAPTVVKSVDYTAVAGDLVPVDCSGGNVTVTLPAAPADKSRIAVKIIALAGSNACTIARGGSDVFNKAGGSTSLTLSLLNQAATLQYEAATGIWYVQSTDAPIGGLDARYALAGATPSGTPGSGSKLVSVAGTRVKLAASTTPVKSAVVTAGTGNTGIVVVGGSNVVAASGSRVGTPLSAGDSYTISFAVDLTDWYIDATVGGEGVTMSWVT